MQTTWIQRGTVSGRVALLLRSAEIQPPLERFVRLVPHRIQSPSTPSYAARRLQGDGAGMGSFGDKCCLPEESADSMLGVRAWHTFARLQHAWIMWTRALASLGTCLWPCSASAGRSVPGPPWTFRGMFLRSTSCHFSEEFSSPALPGSPTAYSFPRDFAFIAWLTGRPASEGFRARLPDRSHFSEGFCFHRLAHRSPRFRGISSQAPLCFHRLAHRLPRFRGISSPAPPGSPTAHSFPRDFAFIAWLTGRPASEGCRARLPDRSHFSEGFCFHRLAHRSPIFRGISSQAPRPLTCFRGILLAPLGSPLTSSRRDSAPRPLSR